jgi:hypothetical protein
MRDKSGFRRPPALIDSSASPYYHMMAIVGGKTMKQFVLMFTIALLIGVACYVGGVVLDTPSVMADPR